MKILFDYKLQGETYSSEYDVNPTAVAIYPKDNPKDVLVYFYIEEYVAYGRALLGTNDRYGIKAFKRDLDEYAKKELEFYKHTSIIPKDKDFTLEYLTSLPLEKIKKYLIDAGFKIKVKKTGFKVRSTECIDE